METNQRENEGRRKKGEIRGQRRKEKQERKRN